MINPKHKPAFSMVTAIFVIIIMASISALIMNVTGKTLKATTQQYQKEQAALLARSYTELAILYTMYYDRSNDCLEHIYDHFGDPNSGYDITINIKYLGNQELLDGCDALILNDGSIGTGFDDGDPTLNTDVATWSQTTTGFYSTISLVIDTYIRYEDFDDPQHRKITFHRRTLQKL